MHHGMYRFLHKAFGLKMSHDIFQMQMDQATDCLPGMTAIHNDICIYSHIPEEHDQHLLQPMETAKEHGIFFNSTKCHIRQPQITFYGAMFAVQGMQLDPSKTQALQDIPTHDSQAKLQSFLGLINYLQPFIPDLSAKTTFLHEQLVKWYLNPSTDTAFQHFKAWICQTLLSATLVYYDSYKPVIVQIDASKYGLGAALIQNRHPIAFASKTLTDIDT